MLSSLEYVDLAGRGSPMPSHALHSKPSDASLHYELGRVLQKEIKLEGAKAEFAKTSALDNTHSSPDR